MKETFETVDVDTPPMRLRGRPAQQGGDTQRVSNCCDPRGCDQFFGPRFARHLAKRYRRHGLDKTAQRIVDFLEQHGIQGATVLEIGGGVGEIQIELLKRGARHATNLELVDAYETEARRLLQGTGLQHRVERRRHDIAADPDGVEPADVVVLHWVVCCYPDHERLLAATADHAHRLLMFSYPPHNPAGRAVLAAENAIFAILRKRFRTFNHPPDAMLAALAKHGLRATYPHRGLGWQVAGLERATTAH